MINLDRENLSGIGYLPRSDCENFPLTNGAFYSSDAVFTNFELRNISLIS